MNKQKGFTIIELIVVVAIIAVLAGIVTTNVMRYINESKILAIKANMSTLKTAAVVYFAEYEGFDGVCLNTTFNSVKTAIDKVNGNNDSYCMDVNDFPCQQSSSWWTFYAPLPDSTWWCVDSLGFSGLINEPLASPDPLCDCTLWTD